VLPISDKALPYCQSIYLYLHRLGYEVAVDPSAGTINKKVAKAQADQWNYMLIAGEQEMNSGMVDVRTRAGGRLGKKRVTEFVEMIAKEKMTTSKAY